MPRLSVIVAVVAVVAAGCGGKSHHAAAPPPSTIASTSTVSRPAVTPPTTVVAAITTTSTLPLPTTSLPCQALPFPVTPVTSPAPSQPVLLTGVRETGDKCVDHVVFDFRGQYPNPPGYILNYGTPPFEDAGSGKPVPVAGQAFIVVRLSPAYGFDYLTGTQTYNGPRDIAVHGANHVRDIAETGDFEGVVTWVIGLDTKRPFSVQATGAPARQLVVTVS
jgi:hypothetical protein